MSDQQFSSHQTAKAPPQPPAYQADDLVDLRVAEKISGLSRATIYRKLADPTNDFPRPVQVSARRIKFIFGELTGWRADRVAERHPKSSEAA